MNRKLVVFLSLMLCSCLSTGCLDEMELNDLAIDMGAGIDLVKPKQFSVTKQFIVPSKMNGSQTQGGQANNAYFIISSTGSDISECIKKNQLQLSRHIFVSYRRNLYIGENMAKHGIERTMDVFNRDPKNRLRTDVWVVKDGEARTLLRLSYPLEPFSAAAASQIYKAMGGEVGESFLNFLMDVENDSTYPTLPAVEIVSKVGEGQTKPAIQLAGRAIFDKNLHLIGYLTFDEAVERLWILGKDSYGFFHCEVPNQKGNVTVNITHVRSRIRTMIHPHNQVEINVELKGTGIVRENNTFLDLSQPENIDEVERSFDAQASKQVSNMIARVQHQFGADVFNFGENINRQHPVIWEQLRNNWKDEFSHANVHVAVKVAIRHVGLVGAPLAAKGSDIKQ